jgi:hypothetical protein
VSYPLLLDEMFSGHIADQLRSKGHDVLAVVADPALLALPDDQILAHAAATGRALVTANIKDFMPLDAQYRAAGQTHAGLIFISSKTFRQDRAYTAAITNALSALLDQAPGMQPGQVAFLPRQ